jgi:hypothetical protein
MLTRDRGAVNFGFAAGIPLGVSFMRESKSAKASSVKGR